MPPPYPPRTRKVKRAAGLGLTPPALIIYTLQFAQTCETGPALQRRFLFPILLPLLAAAGCDDPFDIAPLPVRADSTTLYSVARPALVGFPSAYDFTPLPTGQRRVVVEGAGELGAWDILLGEQGGGFVLIPRGTVVDPASRAGISVQTAAYEAVTSAPADTAAYVRTQPVPLQPGQVYVIRTRLRGTCVYYAKLQPIELDPDVGTLFFRFASNPNCGSRDLQPPQE
jgi:hypothetical protein